MLTKYLLLPFLAPLAASATPVVSRQAAGNSTLTAYAKVTGHNITAHFNITGYKDGRPTEIAVRIDGGLTNDASLGGPFLYHIHTNALPPDGNCTKALAHLDPYNVTESVTCDPHAQQFCQEGDFSGKWGKLNGTADGKTALPQFTLYDSYVRFFPEEASLLGRSIVIHASNKTRLACGNITSMLDGTADNQGKPTYKASTFVKNYPKAAPPNPVAVITPFNGSDVYPDQTYRDALPYPIPLHAIPLNESLNIYFRTATRHIKVNNTLTYVTQPKGVATTGMGPF